MSKEEPPTAKLQVEQGLEEAHPPEEPPRHTQKNSHCQAARLPPAQACLLARTREGSGQGRRDDQHPPYWVGGQQESPPTGSGGGTRTAKPFPETGEGAGQGQQATSSPTHIQVVWRREWTMTHVVRAARLRTCAKTITTSYLARGERRSCPHCKTTKVNE